MDEKVTQHAFWALSPDKTTEILETTKEGINDEEAFRRADVFGKNVFTEDGRITKWRLLLNQFRSPLIFILVIAGVATVALQHWVDSLFIFLAIFVNTILGFYQENRAETALENLKTYIKDRVRVLRDGQEKEIPAVEVVPGDVVHLRSGARISADARIIVENSLSIDESVLTGESSPVSKSIETLKETTELPERNNMVHAGTLVVGGSALAVVTQTGEETQIGRIAELVAKTKREKTPFQSAVERLAWVIAGALLVLVGGVFFLGISRGESVADMFFVAIAMIVGSIPEGLPIALTIILAIGVERLAKRNGVVRKLAAAEALGSTTLILTDKTGTLTEAKMQMKDILPYDSLINGKSVPISPDKGLSKQQFDILKLALVNTDVLVENPDDNPKQWKLSGSLLEKDLVKHAANYDVFVAKLRQKIQYSHVLEFSSKHKFSASFVAPTKEFEWDSLKDKNFIAVMGAPEILLEKSNCSKDEYLKVRNAIEKLSNDGMRIVGIATKVVKNKKDVENISPDNVEGLQFAGIVSFYDPPRPEVADAMQKVNDLGIRVVMVTGDLKGTAIYTARKIGWDVDEGNVMTGKDLKTITNEELLKNLDNIKIFARVSPEDKLRIANLFKETGESVAMTGDGVNDAPGLKAVDIGVAVGSGTDVAKAVADLVLLDNNFQTITAAVEEGRRILANMKKVMVYLLSNALDEVVLIGGAILFGLALPLTAAQILWVNFFSNSFPALAFAFEESFDKDLYNPKDEAEKKLLDAEVIWLILVIGTLTSVIIFGLYWYLLNAGHDPQTVRSFIFATYAIYILFLAWPIRSLKKSIFEFNPFSNKWMVGGIGIGVALTAVAIYIPFFQNLFGTRALGGYWLSMLAAWLVVNIALVEITKWFFRKRKHVKI